MTKRQVWRVGIFPNVRDRKILDRFVMNTDLLYSAGSGIPVDVNQDDVL